MAPIFTSVSLVALDPVVKRLLEMKKEQNHDGVGKKNEKFHEQKWCEKAIRSLASKLKKSGMLGELEKALANQDPMSPCITIPRSLDGRLQVLERKMMPHLIYCRIWRFPSLKSHHQLSPVPHCRFAFQHKKEAVCVNPFHYENSDVQGGSVDNKKIDGAVPPCVLLPQCPVVTPVPSSFSDDVFHSSLGLNDASDTLDLCSDYVPLSELLMDNCDMVQTEIVCEDGSEFMESDAAGSSSTLTELRPMAADGAVMWPGTYEIEYCEPQYWCSVSYYELSNRVGEVFHAGQPSLTVDGFCDPSNAERFCLGLLSNMNRNAAVVETRKHIGRGARFYYSNGDVYVECLSDAAIFVQSINCNLRHGWYPTTVCKVQSGNSLKIFSNQEFSRMLSDSVSQNYETVDALKDVCTIRMSFVKGWGEKYRRQAITATPCWIELHLNGPLQWLDRVLTRMDGPAGYISSRT